MSEEKVFSKSFIQFLTGYSVGFVFMFATIVLTMHLLEKKTLEELNRISIPMHDGSAK